MFCSNYRKIIALLVCLPLLAGCASHPPLATVDYVNPENFKGDWYVIANIPYFGEKNKVESKTSYIPSDREGVYDDVFSARDSSFDAPRKSLKGWAKPLNAENTEYLAVFYWILRSRFSVLHKEDDWMLLGHRNRKLGWIMARSQTLNEGRYQQALEIFKTAGFDPSAFSKVPQFPEDIGKAGYQAVKQKN